MVETQREMGCIVDRQFHIDVEACQSFNICDRMDMLLQEMFSFKHLHRLTKIINLEVSNCREGCSYSLWIQGWISMPVDE